MKIFTKTEKLNAPIFDVYCALERHYAEKFLYLSQGSGAKLAGLGCIVAEERFESLPHEFVGSVRHAPVLFGADAFDPDDVTEKNPLFRALEGSAYVLPEIVLIEDGGERFVQVNSTSPEPLMPDSLSETGSLSAGCPSAGRTIDFRLVRDDKHHWFDSVEDALERIRRHDLDKVVLAREFRVQTDSGFSSREMVANLLAAEECGTLILHEVNGVFFIGSTPELLLRKRGAHITTMCLAGTTAAGDTDDERAAGAAFLLGDEKNLREHGYVVEHLVGCLSDACSITSMADSPGTLALKRMIHLCTPVTGTLARGVSLIELRDRLHPTPALAGAPVIEAKAAIREMEGFNRGFYGGTFGYVDFEGDGEFSVAIRSGVFCRDFGYVYAGCGIVEGSDPAAEYDEIDMKLQTILSAFQGPGDRPPRAVGSPQEVPR
jgi:menaquinone-specific isochorismate synthase